MTSSFRALQLIDLSDKSDKWHWLASLQKRGQTLPSGILVKRLSSDNGLLKMLCTHVVFATKTYSDQASCLTTLYSFLHYRSIRRNRPNIYYRGSGELYIADSSSWLEKSHSRLCCQQLYDLCETNDEGKVPLSLSYLSQILKLE